MKQQPQDIYFWLIKATIELTAPVKKCIHLEIEEHYRKSVALHRANGLLQQEAQKKALAELGCPNEAAKRFCEHHLTIWEADKIRGILKKGGIGSLLRWICLVGSNFYLMFNNKLSYSILLFLAILFFFSEMVPATGRFIMQRKSRRLEIIYWMQLAGWTIIISAGYFSFGAGIVFALLCLASAAFIFENLSIWRKLHRIANVWDEIALHSE